MPTLSTYSFVTLDEFTASIKNLNSNQEENDRLTFIMNAVVLLFDKYTHRKLKTRTFVPSGATAGQENLLLNGDDRLAFDRFLLPQYPVSAVTAISTYESDLLAAGKTDLVSGDWTIERDTGVLTLIDGDSFPRGRNNLHITWTAGYQTTDPEYDLLRQAQIEQGRELWYREQRRQDGVQALSDPGGSITYYMGALLPTVRLVLDELKAQVVV